MTSPTRLECVFRMKTKGSYSVDRRPGTLPAGRVPRLARLLALAHKFDNLLRQKVIAHYAALARLGHVSRARISQITNLLHLAPDIQEAILFLPLTVRGRDPVRLRQLQALTQVLNWSQQRALWRQLCRTAYSRQERVLGQEAAFWSTTPPSTRAVPRSAVKNCETVAITGKEYDGQV
jgi:hypothetical protein